MPLRVLAVSVTALLFCASAWGAEAAATPTEDHIGGFADYAGRIVMAIAALGTAAFGIVEGLKWTGIGLSGYRTLQNTLGDAFLTALGVAYGDKYDALLRAQYRRNAGDGSLSRTLRQGIRAGLRKDTADALAAEVGLTVISAEDLQALLSDTGVNSDLDDAQLRKLGRWELAIDMRVEAAVAAARARYVGCMRVYASLIAIAVALGVGWGMGIADDPRGMLACLVVGIAAIPVAPVAKDLVKALSAAASGVNKIRQS